MVYDSARGVTVLFGGGSGAWLEDTWEYLGRVDGVCSPLILRTYPSRAPRPDDSFSEAQPT